MNEHVWLVRLFVGFVKITGVLPAYLFLKPRVRLAPGGMRKLPKSCILVSNHISLMDFVLYLLVFPFRTIRFLIAEVLYNRSKILALFLELVGGIRTDRDIKSFGFVSNALKVLDDGGTVGIFPQGRLPVAGKVFPFTVSTAFIALQAGVPIVPVYTDGNYGIFKRAGVVIGAPIQLKELCAEGLGEQEQLAHLTKQLEEKVFALKEELNDAEKSKKARAVSS